MFDEIVYNVQLKMMWIDVFIISIKNFFPVYTGIYRNTLIKSQTTFCFMSQNNTFRYAESVVLQFKVTLFTENNKSVFMDWKTTLFGKPKNVVFEVQNNTFSGTAITDILTSKTIKVIFLFSGKSDIFFEIFSLFCGPGQVKTDKIFKKNNAFF